MKIGELFKFTKLDPGMLDILDHHIDTRTLVSWESIDDIIRLTFMTDEVLNIRFATQANLDDAWRNLGNALEETGHFNG